MSSPLKDTIQKGYNDLVKHTPAPLGFESQVPVDTIAGAFKRFDMVTEGATSDLADLTLEATPIWLLSGIMATAAAEAILR